MKSTLELHRLAEAEGIPVVRFALPENGSLSIQDGQGRCYIAMDELDTEAQRKVHLAHELGHCLTGSFYNRYAPRDLRQRHEHRADKWAIGQLIPPGELDEAVAMGYTDLWALAEHFGVTEGFMRKTVCWYTHGNLSAELYF